MPTVKGLLKIADPAQRIREATHLIDDLSESVTDASRIRTAALAELQEQGLSPTEIAKATGMSRVRISQLTRSGPPPSRALLAPDARKPVTVAVVQKKASDSGREVVALTTRDAVDAIKAAAVRLHVTTETEHVPPPGLIDLNRSNLAVLIGPRISALIVQALSADPVIKWRQDRPGNWFITDTKTGEEYHSDFDPGHGSPTGGMACYAHIGRIRRPDGRGNFLYLGGAHAPGTAGAVRYFLSDIDSIFDEVRRGMWSAVVRTVTDENSDAPRSWERVTSIYHHGRP